MIQILAPYSTLDVEKRFKLDSDSTPKLYCKGPPQFPSAVPNLWNLDVLSPEFYYKGFLTFAALSPVYGTSIPKTKN